MKTSELTSKLEEICELPPGVLEPTSVIEEIPGWSSLAFLRLIALIDDSYDVTLKPRQIHECATIGELDELVQRLR